jgi:cell division septum initiation protein DivIVA
MWISKKKYDAEKRILAHEAFLESVKDQAEDSQWERIRRLEKQVKKLKKQIKKGY